MEYDTERIWQEFSSEIERFIAYRVADSSAAEDLLQEVFLKIHRKINTLQDSRTIRSWVFQIARNTITDYYRKQKIKLDYLDELTPEYEKQLLTSDEIIEENPAQAIGSGLKERIAMLPEKYAEALTSVEFQGWSQVKLAEKLGISVSGAKTRVQRARQMLKDSLLKCCHFELDRYGSIINYYPKPCCCCG